MGAQFGPLHRDRAIHVAHSVTFLPEQFHAAYQQELGVGSFEFVRGVGKVQSDVAQSRSTQQGVADRVQHHIPVRMGDAAFRMLDFYPAEDQGQSFAEGVYVVAVADSEFHHFRTHFVVERPGLYEGLPVLFIRTFRIALTERADLFYRQTAELPGYVAKIVIKPDFSQAECNSIRYGAACRFRKG